MSTPEDNGELNEGKHFPMVPLLDFLSPPAGWHVERALCATYSAQASVLAAMLMAMNGDVTAQGSGSSVMLARALRRLKGKVKFLIQHGRLAAPSARRAVLGMLDRFIVSVPFDERTHEGASWHPKVCIIKYGSDSKTPKGQRESWKLWIGSRNFTRDGSWDIGFSLTSASSQTSGDLVSGVDMLASKLAKYAGEDVEWRKSILQLKSVRWDVPKGMKLRSVDLLLPGEERADLPKVPPNVGYALAVAPFIEAGELRRLATATPNAARTLVSTDTDIAAAAQSPGWTDYFDILSLPPGPQDALIDNREANGDDEEPEMGGLHAKFLWFEHRDGATLYLGSPNLTNRGWRRSAEAFVTLEIAKPSSSAAARSVYAAMARFRAGCNRVNLAELTKPGENAVEKLLELNRKMVAFSLQATQTLEPDNSVTVTSGGQPVLPAEITLSVGRIGDIGLEWAVTSIPLLLPVVPRCENSDLLHIRISTRGQQVAWLQHVPFVPPLSEDDRDLPLLQSYLGLNGLLDWLADVLSGVGESGGKDRDWDDHNVARPPTGRSTSLPFSIEAVLDAWVRDPASLNEVRSVMAMARGYAGNHSDDVAARARLESFLKSWPILEIHLQ